MVAAEPALAPKKRNFFSILWGMIRQPRSTLAALAEQGGRSWLMMAFLAMLMVVALVLVSAPISSRAAQEAVRETMASRPGGPEITPEMQAQAARMVTNPLFTLVLPIIGGLAGLWVSWLAWAGGLHLASTVLGGSGNFGHMFQAVVWGWLPMTLRRVLQAIYITATQEIIRNPGLSGWMGSSPAGEASPFTPPSTIDLVLRSFLSQIDLFLVWTLALLVLAVMVTARISTRKASIITLLVWLLFSAISLLPALASGMVSGVFSP